jgi:hypothetical protein
MSTYRLVVCIDVSAESLVDAYRIVYGMMGDACRERDADWESTDEAYDPDGNALAASHLQEVRRQVIMEHEYKGWVK